VGAEVKGGGGEGNYGGKRGAAEKWIRSMEGEENEGGQEMGRRGGE